MGYLDRTFCRAAGHCKNREDCFRYLSPTLQERADLWAIRGGMIDEGGQPAPWIAYSDFSNSCPSYEEVL